MKKLDVDDQLDWYTDEHEADWCELEDYFSIFWTDLSDSSIEEISSSSEIIEIDLFKALCC